MSITGMHALLSRHCTRTAVHERTGARTHAPTHPYSHLRRRKTRTRAHARGRTDTRTLKCILSPSSFHLASTGQSLVHPGLSSTLPPVKFFSGISSHTPPVTTS